MRDGWRRVALGEVTREEGERVGHLEDQVTVLTSTKHHGLVRSSEYFKNRQIHSDDITDYRLVRPGWFAYATNHLSEGSIGLHQLDELGCVSPIYTVFSCRADVHERYLFRLLKSPKLVAQYGLHDQASVDRRGAVRYRDFSKITVDLPPLKEQRRIAEILESVDRDIDRVSRESAKIHSVYSSMFVNSLKNPRSALSRYEVSRVGELVGSTVGDFRFTRLGDFLDSIDAGVSPELEGSPAGLGEWGFLKVSAVGRGGFLSGENKRADDPGLFDPSIEIHEGDLLITRANTPELVGATCVVDVDRPGLMLSDKTLRLNLASSSAVPEYFCEVLRLPELRVQIEVAATGTSGSMKNISQKAIRDLVIPWCDVAEQRRIVQSLAEGRGGWNRTQAEKEKLHSVRRALAAALMSNGESAA
ncbi:restriction endonuclease subunit S [Streptomyces noursei]|uniref:restriction endonuclease subunit S n=1 Tax=Streptomyces noursei TaxID=1971 RepID=UPI003819C4D3